MVAVLCEAAAMTGEHVSRATGGCACRGVRYRVSGPIRHVVNCHCEPCRRITGHFMAATSAHPDDVAFDASGTLRWYDRTGSVQYGFCERCGSTLFWRAADKPSSLAIAAGTLDQPTGLHTELALFGDEAGDYHSRDASIPPSPGAH